MPASTPHRPRTTLLAFGVLALVVAATALLAGPASAHASLTGTVPADGEQVATAPTQVELTYSDALLEVGNAVSVVGPSGPLALDPVQVSDRTLVQPLPADLPPGEYAVRWRAGSGDGHPIEGTFTFTSTAPLATSGPATSSLAPSASTSTSSADASSSGAPPSSATAAPADPAGSSDLPLWLGVPVALLGAAGVAAVVLRRGRRPGAHE